MSKGVHIKKPSITKLKTCKNPDYAAGSTFSSRLSQRFSNADEAVTGIGCRL
jgi:hypothetical protein